MNPLRFRAALIVGALVFTAACGSDSPSPVGPSPSESNTPGPAPAPSTGGATVSGTVSGAGQAGLQASVRLLGAGLAGVTVGVEGTDLSTRRDRTGRLSCVACPRAACACGFRVRAHLEYWS